MKALLLIALFAIFAFTPGLSESTDWKLYDDFSSGVIDSEKWSIDDSSAVISIENGMAKFIHTPGHPNDFSWLKAKDEPAFIQGIKASLFFESCSGDVRGLIGAGIGYFQGDYIWLSANLEPSRNRFSSSVVALDSFNYAYKYDLFWGQIGEPIDIIGTWHTLSILFSENQISYAAEGLGKATRTVPYALQNVFLSPKAIGTRSSNGDGPCVVYVDDVYVHLAACLGDLNSDRDVDGSDIYGAIADASDSDLAEVSTHFGRSKCP